MKLLICLLTFITIAMSCNSSKKALETSKDKQMALQGEYIIRQIGEKKITSPEIKISFDSTLNKVSGFAGCNSFFGSYSIKGKTITFGPIGASKKFCQKEINTVESHILQALNTVNSFSFKGKVLNLAENDKVLIEATKPISTKKNAIVTDTNNTTVIYETSTRGSYEYIAISGSNISISADRNLQNVTNYTCDIEDWNTINSLVENTVLETLHTLKVPSDKRFSDTAAIATLTIQVGDVLYVSPAFDHGNPPKEIVVLVNKVLSIKENILKQ